MAERYIAKVAMVLDAHTVVINKGADAGIPDYGTLRIVRLGPDVIDPDTGENLGPLEHLVGRVDIVHREAKKTTVRSVKSGGESEPISGLQLGLLPHMVGSTMRSSKGVRALLDADVGDYVVKD